MTKTASSKGVWFMKSFDENGKISSTFQMKVSWNFIASPLPATGTTVKLVLIASDTTSKFAVMQLVQVSTSIPTFIASRVR